MSRSFAEFRYYSPMNECEVSLISMADARGDEFWIEIEGTGKAYRESKMRAFVDLDEVIGMGLDPGQVVPT